MTYTPGAVDSVSELSFPLLFEGSEIVVAGRFEESVCVSGSVGAGGSDSARHGGWCRGGGVPELCGPSREQPGRRRGACHRETGGLPQHTPNPRPSQDHRSVKLVSSCWHNCFESFSLSLSSLLSLSPSDDESAASTLRERALALALRYNFVTELTSLIVVQENSRSNFTLGDTGRGGTDGLETAAFAPGAPGGGAAGGGADDRFFSNGAEGLLSRSRSFSLLCLDVLVLIAVLHSAMLLF